MNKRLTLGILALFLFSVVLTIQAHAQFELKSDEEIAKEPAANAAKGFGSKILQTVKTWSSQQFNRALRSLPLVGKIRNFSDSIFSPFYRFFSWVPYAKTFLPNASFVFFLRLTIIFLELLIGFNTIAIFFVGKPVPFNPEIVYPALWFEFLSKLKKVHIWIFNVGKWIVLTLEKMNWVLSHIKKLATAFFTPIGWVRAKLNGLSKGGLTKWIIRFVALITFIALVTKTTMPWITSLLIVLFIFYGGLFLLLLSSVFIIQLAFFFFNLFSSIGIFIATLLGIISGYFLVDGLVFLFDKGFLFAVHGETRKRDLKGIKGFFSGLTKRKKKLSDEDKKKVVESRALLKNIEKKEANMYATIVYLAKQHKLNEDVQTREDFEVLEGDFMNKLAKDHGYNVDLVNKMNQAIDILVKHEEPMSVKKEDEYVIKEEKKEEKHG